jgi:alpha-tubulin suppressor-like RCC1 family protein
MVREQKQQSRCSTNDIQQSVSNHTNNTKNVPVHSIAFGRNYFYPLTCNNNNNQPIPLHTTITTDDINHDVTRNNNAFSKINLNDDNINDATTNIDHDDDNDDNDCCGSYPSLPWDDNNHTNHQHHSMLPLSASCSSQSTIIVSPVDGKVYQTGTMHGIVLTNWKHISIPLPLKCVQVSAGRHYCLARLEGGKAVLSWGAGHFGQLGVIMSNNKSSKNKKKYRTEHDDDSCSSSSDDSDESTSNHHRANGNGTKSTSVKCISFTMQPVLIERLLPNITGSPIQSIAAGDWHALALTESGQIWSWGSNRSMQCGIPLTKDTTTLSSTNPSTPSSSGTSGSLALPLPIPGLPPMKQIAAGRAHSCSLTSSTGKVYCWGSSHSGQCGTGVTLRRSTKGILPSPVQGLPSSLEMIQIDAAGDHCISLSKAGRVFTWGDGREGQLGFSISTSTSKCISLQDLYSTKPRLVSDLDFVAVAASHTLNKPQHYDSVLAQTSTATEKSNTTMSAAQLLARTPKVVSVYASENGSAAISSTGHVYCWGSNDAGQLGIPIPKDVPYEVTTDTTTSDQTTTLQQPSSLPNNNSSQHTLGRLLHVKTFDSKHNILLPIRVKAVDNYYIRSLATGPNHMFCFGTARTIEESKMIVGQTLYEVQSESKNRRKQETVTDNNDVVDTLTNVQRIPISESTSTVKSNNLFDVDKSPERNTVTEDTLSISNDVSHTSVEDDEVSSSKKHTTSTTTKESSLSSITSAKSSSRIDDKYQQTQQLPNTKKSTPQHGVAIANNGTDSNSSRNELHRSINNNKNKIKEVRNNNVVRRFSFGLFRRQQQVKRGISMKQKGNTSNNNNMNINLDGPSSSSI